MKLPIPPGQYDAATERRRNAALEDEFRGVLRRGRDVEFSAGERLVLRSPDGSRWALTVDNAGAVSATAL